MSVRNYTCDNCGISLPAIAPVHGAHLVDVEQPPNYYLQPDGEIYNAEEGFSLSRLYCGEWDLDES